MLWHRGLAFGSNLLLVCGALWPLAGGHYEFFYLLVELFVNFIGEGSFDDEEWSTAWPFPFPAVGPEACCGWKPGESKCGPEA